MSQEHSFALSLLHKSLRLAAPKKCEFFFYVSLVNLRKWFLPGQQSDFLFGAVPAEAENWASHAIPDSSLRLAFASALHKCSKTFYSTIWGLYVKQCRSIGLSEKDLVGRIYGRSSPSPGGPTEISFIAS